MTSFAFVTSKTLREGLDSDHLELQRCLDAGAWKATVVLGGALVEAILTDHLLALVDDAGAKEKILRMTLGQLITAAQKEGALSARTVSLTEAIKEYRNLIHPGREIRLAERADENSALVVKALVQMVSSEIAEQKAEKFGFTAEQLLQKLESDQSITPVLGHLLKETSAEELERLVVDLIPKRVLELATTDSYDDYISADHLQDVHRTALGLAPQRMRSSAAKGFVSVLKGGSGEVVAKYFTYFFKASDLDYLDGNDFELVKAYMIAQVPERINSAGFAVQFKGLSAVVDKDDVHSIVDSVLRRALGKNDKEKRAAKDYLEGEHDFPGSSNRAAIMARVEHWISRMRMRGDEDAMVELEGLREDLDLPF